MITRIKNFIFKNRAIRPLQGPAKRTLICTHPTREPDTLPPVSTRAAMATNNCMKLWHRNGHLFARRLSLCYGSREQYPEGIDQRPGIERTVFSLNGHLDESGCSAVEEGFAGPGFETMILGGGKLELCLSNTFASLLKIKGAQKEGLQVILPLPLIYWIDGKDIGRYINYSRNDYMLGLRMYVGARSWRVACDGKFLFGQDRHSSVELHWFSTMELFYEFIGRKPIKN